MKRIWLPLLALTLLIAVAAPVASATDAGKTVIGETSVVVPAGGEATIDLNAFCMEFGEPFPDDVSPPEVLAVDDVQKVLKTAVSDGTASSEILQTQLAIWYTIEGEWGYDEEDVDLTVAEGLVDAAADGTTEPLTGLGTALDAAIAEGLVEVEVQSWEQTDAEKVFESDAPYYGTGTVLVRNPGDADVVVYYPVGMVLPAADEDQQDMVSYAAEMQDSPNLKRCPRPVPPC